MAKPLDSEFLDPDTVAACLACSINTLRYWRWKGVGPEWVRISPKMVRYPRAKFGEYLRERGHIIPI